MRCKYCGGVVLWDWPIRGDGRDQTTCKACGHKNCQIVEPEPCEDEDDGGDE